MSGKIPPALGGRTIDRISVNPRDPNERRLHTDGRIVLTLRAIDVEDLQLEPGALWTPELIQEVERRQLLAKAHRVALQLLGRRAFSRQQLAERLAKRGFDSVADEVVSSLVAEGWLNDQELAETLAEQWTSRGYVSEDLLNDRLRARGIDEDVARSAADRARQSLDAADVALHFARKKYRESRHLPPASVARRIAAALARRGHDEETITEVLDALCLGDAIRDR